MTNNEKNTATILHLSALSQYLIPFGNFILPTIIWGAKKEGSEFIDSNGKSVLNFQLSTFMYSFILLLIGIPVLICGLLNNTNFDGNFDGNYNIEAFRHSDLSGFLITLVVLVLLFALLKIAEFILIILGAVRASNGEKFNYPLTINFIK